MSYVLGCGQPRYSPTAAMTVTPATKPCPAWHSEFPNTRDKEERTINNHIVPALGGLRLREVTVRKLNAFLQSLAVDAPSLARNSRIILNGIFQIAATDLPGFTNPVRETIHIKKSKPHPKALTAADVALIRQAISDWQSSQSSGPKRGKDLPDVLSVALGSGLRIGEILALLWSDVDLVGDPPTITVTGTLSQATGKGVYRRDCPKSEDSRRVVPIPQWLVSVLLERRLAMSKPGELVFSTRNGTVLSPTNVRRSLRAALKAADLPERLKDVHPHLFRSTPELHIFVAYGVFFGVFVLVVGILVGGFGSLIGDGVFG
ncbi:tyrosine-type recombinase/integrase [Mobiluncus mulieris]|uniref:tyrosine-type recombinase/integrase n=1 Tax=Mobiluncus mulieris TaxID=2052 RepID=UPI002015EF58|nr:site-specific integrase [Mobiluncus mulieris]